MFNRAKLALDSSVKVLNKASFNVSLLVGKGNCFEKRLAIYSALASLDTSESKVGNSVLISFLISCCSCFFSLFPFALNPKFLSFLVVEPLRPAKTALKYPGDTKFNTSIPCTKVRPTAILEYV